MGLAVELWFAVKARSGDFTVFQCAVCVRQLQRAQGSAQSKVRNAGGITVSAGLVLSRDLGPGGEALGMCQQEWRPRRREFPFPGGICM